MRKKVLGLVMAALAISTFGAFAQTETQQTKPSCEQTATCKKDKKECRKGEGKHKKGPRMGSEKKNPFEGIQLTEQQTQQLEQLKAERKAQKESDEKNRKEAREQERKAYNEKIAKILTPEQYAQYEENCRKMKAAKADKKKVKAERMKKKPGKDAKASQKKKEHVDAR